MVRMLKINERLGYTIQTGPMLEKTVNYVYINQLFLQKESTMNYNQRLRNNLFLYKTYKF